MNSQCFALVLVSRRQVFNVIPRQYSSEQCFSCPQTSQQLGMSSLLCAITFWCMAQDVNCAHTCFVEVQVNEGEAASNRA